MCCSISLQGGNWWHLEFTPADTSTIRPIYVDSLCDRAIATLRRFLTDTVSWPEQVRLAHAGHYFIAESARNHGHGEFLPQYIFDETLTRVYYPCANGQRCPS